MMLAVFVEAECSQWSVCTAQARTQRLPEVLVPQLGVSYMLNSVVSRYARSQRVPTLMKLDVEDSKLEEG